MAVCLENNRPITIYKLKKFAAIIRLETTNAVASILLIGILRNDNISGYKGKKAKVSPSITLLSSIEIMVGFSG